MKPVIVFVSAVTPGQFNGLAEYLHAAGLAETWYLTSRGHVKTHGAKFSRLLPFTPDGPITGAQGYYYSDKAERSARISRGVLSALTELRRKTRIDLVFAHGMWGAPLFLYDEIDAAIASYIEFPSYAAHGWDKRYPPDLSQRLSDRNMEMLSFHQILKSDLTIVPSAYAKEAKAAGLDIITWSLERSGTLKDGGGYYYQSIKDAISTSGDTYRLVDVLAKDVGVIGIFSDWPATVTYYANCMGLK